MRELIWTPLPTGYLLDELENATNVSKNIVVTIPPPPPLLPGEMAEIEPEPTVLSWTCTPELPPQLVVSVNGLSLSVSSPDLMGSFPITELTYLKPGTGMDYNTIKSWDDLPSSATEIITFRPYPEGSKTFTLHVTTDTGESNSYQLRIRANFDTGKANLQKAVEARRKTNAIYS